MKHSNIWFALILIASALLLSAEKNVSAQGLGPSQSLPQHRNSAAQHAETNAKPQPSAPRVEQPQAVTDPVNGQSSPKEVRTDRYDDSPCLNRVVVRLGARIANVSALNFFNFLVLVATGLIALFNGQLVGVTNEMRKAAEAALDVNRPFLLVTNVSVEIRHSDFVSNADIQIRHTFFVNVALKNFGVSPADIIDYTAAAEPLDPPRRPDFKDPPVWYGPLEYLNEPIIGPGEPVPDRIHTGNGFTDREYQMLAMHEKKIAIYGRIHYRGASQKVFETRFYWWCTLLDPNPPQVQRCFTKKWNDHT
jgi:hypothetical protein